MLTVYTTSICKYCKAVKEFLDKEGINYETINLEEQPEKQEEAFALAGSRAVPITTDGTSVVVGYLPDSIAERFGKKIPFINVPPSNLFVSDDSNICEACE